ncbi:MAG: F0F1 ATP synthase subunit B [Prevotellaceae bacterium]|jgi:F-type H+-transporting ATPase subunit b|nr:F0F1 ATP synthase subunit B [Prevotellaceae bacterium]
MPALLTPDFGLLFWMLFSFLLVFGVLAKFGFPVITRMVSDRQNYIRRTLEEAEETNRQTRAILDDTHRQQEEILKKAMADGEKLIRHAQQKATEETEKQLEAARQQIAFLREKALHEINAQVALLSMDMAEKILHRQLDDKAKEEAFILQMLDEAEHLPQ